MVYKMMFRYLVVKTYPPKTFDIIFNGARGITRTMIGWCKQFLFVVFVDFHFAENILGN